MSDVFTPIKRAEVMSRIRGSGNLTTEVALASALRAAKIGGWRRHIQLRPRLPKDAACTQTKTRISVKPDFLFRKHRLAIFVDGCFWHFCPLHSKIPTSNREFWHKKLKTNAARDSRADAALQAAGWRVLRIWEHEMVGIEAVIGKVRDMIGADA
jgi:DNA mismatch endonuclease (patch repair protein)